jgi:hypothetical protein
LLLNFVEEVQIPILAAMLLGACSAKFLRTVRARSLEAGLGPTALFPVKTRRPLALFICAIEFGLGIGLIVTAGEPRYSAASTSVRLGACLLFLVATSALVELRTTRPDIGCGCFGDFSTAPVSARTLARSALLAGSALATINVGQIQLPRTSAATIQVLAILAAELIVIGALSPELGEGLIRLGYSEPCELRNVPVDRTITALRRSKQWRKLSAMISDDVPADIWRELCWRYVVYPSSYDDREVQLVFAVFLQQRRPTVHSALVDAVTGEPVPFPASASAERRRRPPIERLLRPLSARLAAREKAHVPGSPEPDLPLSSDLYLESNTAQDFEIVPLAVMQAEPAGTGRNAEP